MVEAGGSKHGVEGLRVPNRCLMHWEDTPAALGRLGVTAHHEASVPQASNTAVHH